MTDKLYVKVLSEAGEHVGMELFERRRPEKNWTDEGPEHRAVEVDIDRPSDYPWVPTEARSGFVGKDVMFPRTALIRRFVVPTKRSGRRRNMQWAIAMGHRKVLTNAPYGPLHTPTVKFTERESGDETDLSQGSVYGCRQPISDIFDKGEYQPSVDGVSGRWISFFHGEQSPQRWFDTHTRMNDWTSAGYSDEELWRMAVGGKVKSERFSIQARNDDQLSTIPNGMHSYVSPQFRDHPMFRWNGRCGNMGPDGAHYSRATRALEWLLYRCPDMVDFLAEDAQAMARDVTFWLSPYEARPGSEGENPYWMLRQSLAYRLRGTQPILRDLGWGMHVVALALDVLDDERDIEFHGWSEAMLKFAAGTVSPSGFSQRKGWRGPSPSPEQSGVLEDEIASAEIEAPIFHKARGELMVQDSGESIDLDLTHAVTAEYVVTTNRLVDAYLEHHPEGGDPQWPTYWIIGKGGTFYDKARPCPKGRNGFNGFAIYEMGMRCASDDRREKIRARKPWFEDHWSKHPEKRPWMAGLLGLLA